METMSAPKTAVQNPSTCHPRFTLPAIHDVSRSMHALITIRKSPSVSSTMGAVTNLKIGLTMAFSTPKMSATISNARIFRLVVGVFSVMPASNHVATASAAALASSRRIVVMHRS